jgi:hypothetical protein
MRLLMAGAFTSVIRHFSESSQMAMQVSSLTSGITRPPGPSQEHHN